MNTGTRATLTAFAGAFLAFASMSSSLVKNSFAFAPLPMMTTTRHGYLSKDSSPLSRQNLFDFLKQDDKEGKSEGESKTADDKEEASYSDDPVDKIFSFFFGEKEESPMGMKRFGRGEFAKNIEWIMDRKTTWDEGVRILDFSWTKRL